MLAIAVNRPVRATDLDRSRALIVGESPRGGRGPKAGAENPPFRLFRLTRRRWSIRYQRLATLREGTCGPSAKSRHGSQRKHASKRENP